MTDTTFSIKAYSAFYSKIPNAELTFEGSSSGGTINTALSVSSVATLYFSEAKIDGAFNIQTTAAMWPKTQNAKVNFIGQAISATIIDSAFDIGGFFLAALHATPTNVKFVGESTAVSDLSATAVGAITISAYSSGPSSAYYGISGLTQITAEGASTNSARFGINASASASLANGNIEPTITPSVSSSASEGGGGGWKHKRKRKKRQQQQDEELIAIINMAIPQILAMIDANEIENFHN